MYRFLKPRFSTRPSLAPLCWVWIIGLVACVHHDDPGTSDQDWPVYLGDKQSSHYSTLSEINTANVAELQVAWTYRTGDLWDPNFSQIQTNPLVVGGILYGTSPTIDVFALDAANGKEIWRFDPSEQDREALHPLSRFLGVSRGVALWSDGPDKRLFFSRGPMLYALNADTGLPINEFGVDGAVDLRLGLGRDVSGVYISATSPGIVYRDLLILGSRVGEWPGAAPGYIRAFNVRTGEIAWTFHTIPQPGEFGYETWPTDAWQTIGGANSWAGMSLDESRGIVYVPTGSAAFDFWGGDRKGKNLFANSLVALDAGNGRRNWHYQIVHHDLWDRDLPAPPNLVTVERDGKRIDAVAQITKSGHIFLFDRTTGAPLFDIEEREVPASHLKGEEAWLTQPFPVLPKPFARQQMTESDINDLDPDTSGDLLKRFQQLSSKGQFLPLDTNGVIIFPGFDGGGEWGGAAVDPDGVLYVNSSEMPWIGLLFDKTVAAAMHKSIPLGERTYLTYCAACHGEEMEGEVDQSIPPLSKLDQVSTPEMVQQKIREGSSFMPSFRFLPENEANALIAYLFGVTDTTGQDEMEMSVAQQGPTDVPYAFMGFNRFTDANGYPAVKPPWGTLSAIDLNTGDYLWQVPLGEYSELSAKGVPQTGTENYGGAIVTAGGLVFIAATKDRKFRAFNKRTGEQLWEAGLPAAGFATPSTYRVGGRQYVVVAAGGGKVGQPSGDSYVAFALPLE